MIERAAILSTGDEITTGKVVDTNSNYIADKLIETGLDVASIVTVGDVSERIVWAWEQAMVHADVIISTGGIGPTADDLTTELVARVAGVDLVFSEEVAENIRRIFASLNRTMPENNLKQAQFPAGATIIPNHLGTAPGYRLALETPHGRKHLLVLPGVPREMKPMLEESVLPWIGEMRGGGDVFLTRTFQTFGISESGLDELVSGVIAEDEGKLAFRANFPQISMRVTVRGKAGEVERRVEGLAQRLREKIGAYVYGEGDVSMEGVVGQLLKEQGKNRRFCRGLLGRLGQPSSDECAGQLGLFPGQHHCLCGRGKNPAAQCQSRYAEPAWRGQRGDGQGNGQRRPDTSGHRYWCRAHRHCRTGRRHTGQAGGDRLSGACYGWHAGVAAV